VTVRLARRPLPRRFFARDTRVVARELLGCLLWARPAGGEACAGRIVEVEAYLGRDDPASHAAPGPTPRSAIMYGPPGHAYVYLSYGVHHCLNAVTEPDGRAGAVLLRAIEPVAGAAAMAVRRGTGDPRRLGGGPGRLCQALGIDRAWNGLPLAGAAAARVELAGPGSVWVARGPAPAAVAVGPRIGIRKATASPLRFCDRDSRCLSRPPGSGSF
jgi:DNA-3-methyladenine glycosylase